MGKIRHKKEETKKINLEKIDEGNWAKLVLDLFGCDVMLKWNKSETESIFSVPENFASDAPQAFEFMKILISIQLLFLENHVFFSPFFDYLLSRHKLFEVDVW